MLNNNQQYFLSLDHKFKIIFIITSSLTVLSVFNRLTKLFSGHVTDQVIVRKKCHFIWEWKTETSEGTFVKKQMCFFPVFLGFLHTAADWETAFGRSVPLELSTMGPPSHDCSFRGTFEIKSARFVFSSPPKIHKTPPKLESLSSNSWVEQPTSCSSIQPTLKLLTTYNVEKGEIHERERHFYTATTTFPNNWFHTALAPGKQSTSKCFKTSLMEWWTKEQHLNPFFRHSLVQNPLRWWEATQFGFRNTQYRAVIHNNFFWQPSFAVQGSSLNLQHFE